MLSRERNETLTRFGAGTPMGELLRRYWWPVAFSADQQQIVSTSLDGTIRYWDRTTGRWLATSAMTGSGYWLTVTESGLFAASSASDKILRFVRDYDVVPASELRDQLDRPDLVNELLTGDPKGRYRAAAQKLNLDEAVSS